MEKRVGYVCAYCGSSAVLMDAWAEWDAQQQDWVLQDTVAEAFCCECDGETSLVELELATESKAGPPRLRANLSVLRAFAPSSSCLRAFV